MGRLPLAGVVAGTAALIAGSAPATELEFSYSGSAIDLGLPVTEFADWTQSSTPTPVSFVTGSLTEVAVAGHDAIEQFGVLVAGGPITDVLFFSSDNEGGFDDQNVVGDSGPQIYTGSEAAPVFTPDVYSLEDGTLTVTAVTEPAAWAMILVGVGGIGGILRSRRRVALAQIPARPSAL